MQASAGTVHDNVREALAFVSGLAARPENLVAFRLRDGGDIVVIERGASAGEDELMAVRLTSGKRRRTALGRLRRDQGRTRWQLSHPGWAAQCVEEPPGRSGDSGSAGCPPRRRTA